MPAPRVLVGMSGGVDSSVTAALLLEQGYDVVGSQMKLLHGVGGDHGCCGPGAQNDARAVADQLGISFEVVDVSERFEETVLDDFFTEHRSGRTPNPCARCNEYIKFGAFFDRADELDCEFVATGHYARVERGVADDAWHLLRAADAGKDQSYVLHMLGQEQLARTLLPLGGQTKAQTRVQALERGLATAGEPDSQEVCFVPDGDHASFVEEFLPKLVREGEVVDTDGAVVGTHRGSFRFTVGQRKGLGVDTHEKRYVLDIDPEANRVVVGPSELLARRGLRADRASWVSGHAPDGPTEADIRIRDKGTMIAAVVEAGGPGGTELDVTFRSPQHAIAPGQSVVVYAGDEVLGGGRIIEAIR